MKSGLSRPLGIGGLVAAVVASAVSLAQGGTTVDLRIASTGKEPELVKKLPVAKRAGQKPKVIASLGPSALGNLKPDDRLLAGADFEATICLKPHPRYVGFPCVGRVYGYDPTVRGKLVLGPSAGTRGGKNSLQIGKAEGITCRQKQPHRNRHCMVSIPLRERRLPDELPCDPCYLNLVGEATDKKARKGEVVVVGSHDRDGAINQARTNLVAMRLRPGDAPVPKPRATSRPVTRKIPVADEGAGTRDRVVYSIPVRAPREGESLFVESRLKLSIGHLPYKVTFRNGGVLAMSRKAVDSAKGSRRVAHDKLAKISLRNGWTCTHGRSAHRTPCVVHKVGGITFTRSSQKTFHVNVVVGAEARLLDGQRFKKGSVRVRKGYLRVWRG